VREEEEVLVLKVQKEILDECLSIIRIDFHRDKRKGVLGLSQEAYLEKLQRNIVCMRVNLRLFSLSRVMVLGIFYVPRINMEWIKRMWYHMLQLLEA
jgi:hypothetical protein